MKTFKELREETIKTLANGAICHLDDKNRPIYHKQPDGKESWYKYHDAENKMEYRDSDGYHKIYHGRKIDDNDDTSGIDKVEDLTRGKRHIDNIPKYTKDQVDQIKDKIEKGR
jgi:YD repeat-containing protein